MTLILNSANPVNSVKSLSWLRMATTERDPPRISHHSQTCNMLCDLKHPRETSSKKVDAPVAQLDRATDF